MKLFVTAINTDSGKTLVSSILVEALSADYWKPIQAGLPRDTDTVIALITNKASKFHPEAYLLNSPESPHSSAKKDGVTIDLKKIFLPQTDNHLIIEGAGGILVPLNDKDFVIDIAATANLDIILVSNLYLGSINHTLLSIEELKRRKLRIKGIIFNGERNNEAEEIILRKSGLNCLLKIEKEANANQEMVTRYAKILKPLLLQ